MVRNSTCHNHWQWEREENTYKVCRGNGQIWVFLQGKSVHLSRPARQRVNISWYFEGIRGARCEESLQNKVPISTEKETKPRGLFVTSNPQNITSTMATGDAQSWTRHVGLTSSSPQPRLFSQDWRAEASRSAWAPKISLISSSPTSMYLQHAIAFLLEIQYLNDWKIPFIIICKYHFNHKLNLKSTLSVHDC